MNKIDSLNIRQALQFALKQLSKNKILDPLFEAELLLSNILKKEREHILTYPNKKISQLQFKKFKTAVKQRVNNTPFAYISEYKYFYGLKFFINNNVLVPRPETEMMVEEALKYSIFNNQHSIFIDIGTGSGCIITAIVKNILDSGLENSNYTFIASDISSKALATAKKNAKLNKVNRFIKFYQGNLLHPIINIINKSKIENHKSQIIITANLPYLTPTQIKNSPSIQKEPHLALTAGSDGLKYYRILFKQINSIRYHLKAKCYQLPATQLILEIDHTQKTSITKLIKQELPKANFEIKKDLGGHYRLVIISIN
ncbi:MAG: Release factor glutamine methyltransferase [Candidatus Falkowbacteria bacterium GW2011_GWC2_38_22]|uniref:Release factor glutamine methyltransferase n=1 Tax=Candidatus Falkowbacteria bacterium GW2011_GWE1_38_31 TaxID=1618638 RepID=A0A0G0JWM5_9BACT|nr:MAG: Release factor glutamine methyltransferase [Candidatus Falkowbacteria bacterium GW2011_GWF2_38_1205]KKQ62187.1 MAG: Release factor glutamine methyltransferase [Candidatus Falkowbacteria bacterium GW2011_GWC2_38_22]KKQ64337.1 MAG: Release factor glutamine methyltransferase [Candidatus Falkowbacteria bacterium GW2011_GWF1_38_22]KKQ66314.1 MAG: Release factor glutamine methyltransferase [Candidatus Falkowbacteria bacterium GW2011_GWE2_38_254]KKQ71042.1 MAG: Release factor glutamine methylt